MEDTCQAVSSIENEVAVETDPNRREAIDRLGPEASGEAISQAIATFMGDEQREIWRRRRETLLHRIRVLENNLDYDLRARGIAA
jgi:hypothetical protein